MRSREGRWATFCGRIEAVRKDSPATPAAAAAASAVAAGVCVTTAVVCVALCSYVVSRRD